MELLSHYGINQRMITRSKRLASIAMVVTAGTLCSYSHFRNHFRASALLTRNGSDDKNWFSSLVAKRFKTMRPSLSEVIMDTMLRFNEYTHKLDTQRPGIVSSFETNHFRANNPLEDRHCECYLKFNGAYLFGIFDGHSGWYCSESLRTRLPLYISLALMNKELRNKVISEEINVKDVLEYLGHQGEDELQLDTIKNFEEKQKRFRTGIDFFVNDINMTEKIGNDNIDESLKYTYLSLDQHITIEAIPDGICNDPIWSGLSGAVAVTAYIKDDNIYISNTGDCRAVLGKRTKDGNWIDIPLSEDHITENMDEVKRIKEEHPKEKNVICQERLLGQLQPLRSFGDVPYKWSLELHRNVLDVLYGHPSVPRSLYLTPPYLTAEPEVTHTKIEKDNRFLIIATDGLWDFVSNEKAVRIIGSYLDDLKNNVEHDENGATQLIRYALGKGNKNKLADMLRIHENVKRDYHDDITVTVVYFDDNYTSLQSKL